MKRVLIALVLTLLVGSDASAQFLRGRTKKSVVIDAAPAVSITLPTSQSTGTTTASSVNLEIECFDDRPPCTTVTWAVSPGGQTGTATRNVTTGAWEVLASVGTLTVGQDGFTSTGSNDLLVGGHTPNTGSAWAEAQDTNANDTLTVYASTNAVGPSATRNSEMLIGLLTLSQALSGGGNNFTISGTKADAADPGATAISGLIYNRQDASNYCGFAWFTSSGANLRHIKVLAGSATITNVSPNLTVPLNGIIKADINGTAIKAYVDNVEKMSLTPGAPCTTSGGGVGIFFGYTAGGSNAQHVNSRIDDFIVVDRGASTTGIPLVDGANTITITGTDSGGNPSVDVLVLTKSGTDTTNPAITRHTPTSGPSHTQTTAGLTVAGTATDNVGVTAVTWTCDNCTSGTSGSATFVAPDWTFNVNLGCSAGGTLNTIVTTAVDLATNPATNTLLATCDSTDTVDPVVTIQTNGGNGAGVDYSTAALTVSLTGDFTDTGGSGVVGPVSYTNAAGSGGNASGLNPWTISAITLAVGPNLITVHGCDGAGRCHDDTITITRTVVPLAVTTGSLPDGVIGVAYNQCFAATGGTPPYTWTLFSGTLPSWASIALDTTLCGATQRYKLTGTPDAAATTSSLVFRATDDVAATANSASLSLTTAAASADYYTGLSGRMDFQSSMSFDYRTMSASQLNAVCNQGSPLGGGFTCAPHVVVDYAGDTDLHKQTGAKFTIPFWALLSPTLAADVTTTATDFTNCTGYTVPVGKACFQITGSSAPQDNNAWTKVDNEFVLVNGFVNGSGFGNPGKMYLVNTRGQGGSALATHTLGAALSGTTNSSLRSPGINFNTQDGNTYVFAWDVYWTDSFVGSTFTHKAMHFLCSTPANGQKSLCFEVRANYTASSSTATVCQTTPVGAKTVVITTPTQTGYNDVRGYNVTTTEQPWLSTGGNTYGTMTYHPASDTVCHASTALHAFRPNTWTRFVLRLEQRADDYDYATLWVIDETHDKVKILDSVPISVDKNPINTNGNRGFKYYDEWLSSSQVPMPARISGGYGNYVLYRRSFATLMQTGLVGSTTLTDAALESSGVLARPQ